MDRSALERTIEAVWHMEAAKIIAKLARMLRDVGLAEEIAQDAWVAALEQWAATGLPENPGGLAHGDRQESSHRPTPAPTDDGTKEPPHDARS